MHNTTKPSSPVILLSDLNIIRSKKPNEQIGPPATTMQDFFDFSDGETMFP